MKIRIYQDGDYESIEDCIEPFGKLGYFEDIRDRGVYMTVTEKNKPIACGGIIYDKDDEGIVWLTLSHDMCCKPITLMRILKDGFRITTESFNLKRVTAKVMVGFEIGERFVRRFGFKPTEETIKIFTNTYRIYQL